MEDGTEATEVDGADSITTGYNIRRTSESCQHGKGLTTRTIQEHYRASADALAPLADTDGTRRLSSTTLRAGISPAMSSTSRRSKPDWTNGGA